MTPSHDVAQNECLRKISTDEDNINELTAQMILTDCATMAVWILLVPLLAVASCEVETTTAGEDRNCRGYTRDGLQCSLPFIYKGVSYHTCTDVDNPPGRYWCSLTPDFDADKQWKRCAGIICDDCNVYTTSGRKCVFPFVYKGKTYNYCTTDDNGDNLWCAHSSVYNGQRGKCSDTLCGNCTVHTERHHQCKFPFTYKRVQYEHCTRRDNKRPWCSLNGRFRRRGVDWDNCVANDCPEQPVMPVVLAATEENTARCSATLGYSSAYSAYTVNGKKCALPFIYKGVSYPSVTDVDNRRVKWCSLTPNFDRDRRWEKYFGEICSGCKVRTKTNGLCHFPFEYKGRNFTYCTKADNPRLWCSYDPVYNNRWGPCTGRTECPEKTTEPVTTASSSTMSSSLTTSTSQTTSLSQKLSSSPTTSSSPTMSTSPTTSSSQTSSFQTTSSSPTTTTTRPYRDCKDLKFDELFCEITQEKAAQVEADGLRLMEGNGNYGGRVEVFHNGTWGTICGHNFDDADANTICRMFDCGHGLAMKDECFYEGTGPIWLDELDCPDSANHITQCSHNGYGNNDCDHNQEVGVFCFEE